MQFNLGTGSGGVGTSQVTINAKVRASDNVIGTEIILENKNAPYQVGSVDLAATTYTTVAVPAKAGGVIITPPFGNTASLTLKGASGDTGTRLSNTAPTILTFHTTPPGTIGLFASGIISGIRLDWF